ncbi:ShlB/FhaC/HecB family hemolysin secretion/activation protein [Oleiagrimonas sp. MCCC 1A03011]|uniref:ShlB/FhaC/HecB family hemolysin secretion/activation protein n=1 Tax=Oleiagrimonas sp. MCCC 1A03011 TaxID=1926883 RepID=UPI000DD6A0D5|nr:ShlB/FhaC/HecB family hemolysin secretion/activation protein [Oleiagrimonas sp. MCCC 1A03011]
MMIRSTPFRMLRLRAVPYAVLAACLFASTAQAAPQTVPSTLQNDAQRLQRYYEQQQATPKKPTDPLQEQKAEPKDRHAVAKAAGPGFVLRRVRFSASVLLKPEALQQAVKPYLGRKVTKSDLDAMLDRINDLYRAKNITTARAILPSQSINDGVVRVELVEGRLGKITVAGDKHVRKDFILRRIDQQSGQIVDANQLRKNLVYLNQTTDLTVRALLAPGAARGQTDIRLAVQEPDRHDLVAFVDNSGVDSTGRYRYGLQGHLYGLFGVDDLLEGNIAHSKGGNDGAISYSVPLFVNNGRLGVSFAHSQINILDRAFRDLDITGTSTVKSINYKQPFIATMRTQFSGVAAYTISESVTRIGGKQIADTTNHSATLGLSVDHSSDGRRWNITQLVTRLDSNEPMLGKTHFNLTPGSAFLIQRLGRSHWALRANAGWQFSSGTNLPSANLFQIGGPGSVRGYERGVLAGSRGYYVGLELHRAFTEKLDLFAFADHGEVRADYPKSSSISGAGLGGMYQYRWLTASADVAKPFDTVTPQQDSIRFDFRLSVNFD